MSKANQIFCLLCLVTLLLPKMIPLKNILHAGLILNTKAGYLPVQRPHLGSKITRPLAD